MLDLVCILDLNEAVIQFHPNADSSSLHIVGQEQDGTIIYTIDAPRKGSDVQRDECVTYIGILDQRDQPPRILLVHDKRVQIVNASVDPDKVFVGFVTVEQTRITGAHGKRQQQDIYKAYLAEIRPQNRTFYLNLERESYLKVQFLYGTQKAPLHSSREAHMLVFLHKESVGLYHLSVATEGETNVLHTLSNEPRKEQIVHKKFVWSQWDSSTQLLFVVYLRKHGKDCHGQITYSPILACYRFNETSADLMFDYVLDIPLSHSKTRTACQYLEDGPFHTTPDLAINMRVLTSINGGLNVCYQTVTSDVNKKDNSSVVIQYSVLMLNHGKTLICRCAHLPLSVAQKARLHFDWIGAYILVYLPGYFTHLLNVGVELEPSHHICWNDPSWPLKSPDKCALHSDQHIVPSLLVSHTCPPEKVNDKKCANVYEPSTRMAYRLSVSDQAVRDIFTCHVDLPTRLSLFHYSILHAKDLVLTQQLFKIVCDDTTNPDLPNILQEILTALTFAQMRRVADVKMLHCLPFTCAQTLRGQVVHAASRVRLFSISYSNLGLSSFCDKRDPDSPPDRFWDTLVYCLKNCGSFVRFNCQSVKQEMDQNSQLKNHNLDKVQNISFFRRLEAAAKSVFSSHGTKKVKETTTFVAEGNGPVSASVSSSSSRTSSRPDQALGSMPPFLSKSGEENQISGPLALLLQKTMEMLSNHLVKWMKKESRNRIRHAAEEFVRNQILQCRTFCHLIWSVLGSEEIEFVPLNVPVHDEELPLFSLLERFHLATEVLAFPQPPGFKFYFATLCFRTLDLRDFIQYIDRGVVQVSIELATQMLEDLDDSPLNVEAKLQVISRLPRAEAIECLQHWDHPISLKFLGSKYTTTCITDDSSIGWEIFPTPPNLLTGDTGSTSSSEHRSLSGNVYPPVKTLIRLLEKKDPGLSVGECLGNLHLDSRFIEESAMLYTYAECQSEGTDVRE